MGFRAPRLGPDEDEAIAGPKAAGGVSVGPAGERCDAPDGAAPRGIDCKSHTRRYGLFGDKLSFGDANHILKVAAPCDRPTASAPCCYPKPVRFLPECEFEPVLIRHHLQLYCCHVHGFSPFVSLCSYASDAEDFTEADGGAAARIAAGQGKVAGYEAGAFADLEAADFDRAGRPAVADFNAVAFVAAEFGRQLGAGAPAVHVEEAADVVDKPFISRVGIERSGIRRPRLAQFGGQAGGATV